MPTGRSSSSRWTESPFSSRSARASARAGRAPARALAITQAARTYCSGFSSNFFLQSIEQNWYVRPWNSDVAATSRSSTSMPHTGSRAMIHLQTRSHSTRGARERDRLLAWRRKGEDDHRGRPRRRPPEERRASRGGRDVLLASRLVREDTAGHRAAWRESIEERPVAAVEYQEVPVQLSGEEQIAGRGSDRGQHRPARSVAPANRPGGRIDGGQPAVAQVTRIGREAAAHVVSSPHVLELLGLLEGAAKIHRVDEEQIHPRVEGRPVPLNPAQRARAGANPFRRGRQLDVLST